MSIQRQYSLPNCQLVVEGRAAEPKDGAATAIALRPTLSEATHVECYFSGNEAPLVGGRDLLDSLAQVVSEYAQEFLSGVSHPDAHNQRRKSRLVQIERIDSNLHRLTVQPIINNGQGKTIDSQTVHSQRDLTTVQLFDLVEAIDQFFADAQTLPEVGLQLSPLAKRYAAAQEPVMQRSLPALLGLSGLAAAAAAMFALPLPEVKPVDPVQPSTSQVSPSPVASPGGTTPPKPDQAAETSKPEASPTASTEKASTEKASTEKASSTSSASPTSTAKDASAVFASAPEITDDAEVETLLDGLQTTLYDAWNSKPEPAFTEALVYQVAVNSKGEVVGYNSISDDALKYIDAVPLKEVLKMPRTDGATRGEAIAQYRVVFTPKSVIEISPWKGDASSSSDASSSDSSDETESESN
jgi:hypothetical protein